MKKTLIAIAAVGCLALPLNAQRGPLHVSRITPQVSIAPVVTNYFKLTLLHTWTGPLVIRTSHNVTGPWSQIYCGQAWAGQTNDYFLASTNGDQCFWQYGYTNL